MPLRLVMLSPYRMPAHHALMLGEEDTAGWLMAHRALWYPSLLKHAHSLPIIADPSDHSQPHRDSLYAIPVSPPPYIPDNWDELVRQVGALAFRAGPTWETTTESLRTATAGFDDVKFENDAARPFFALGFGWIVLNALFEAMEHDRVIDDEAFTREVLAAAAGTDRDANLKSAAERLAAARDALYPANIHLIDLAFLGSGSLPSTNKKPQTVVVTANTLARCPLNILDELKRGLSDGTIELAGGIDHDRPDATLPIESQLWNLRRGQKIICDWFGHSATVYARSTTAFHPYVPNWLAQANLNKAIYVSFDGGVVPHHSAVAIRWPAPDGRQVDALTRAPQSASDPQTYFHLAHYLHQTIMQDQTALLVFRHGDRPAGPWHDDWLTLSALAPVFGHWTTVGRFLDEAGIGEYSSAASADDFGPEDLESAVSSGQTDPVSRFARHLRLRRRVDAARTYLALLQSLGTRVEVAAVEQIGAVEDELERRIGTQPPSLPKVEHESAAALAHRLVARSKNVDAGWIVLNPCPFTRRVGMELSMANGVPPVGGPVKVVQRDGEIARVVVEIPGLGYAWIPRQSTEPPKPKITLASGTTIRNEFFEADIDPTTGGLRAFRDARDRINRLGQQLAWQPGSTAVATEVHITACGPALGEITATGNLVDGHNQLLARFRQRFRAWLGRPLLEILVEIQPDKPPIGYAWHAYYGARFAWADERAVLNRGVFGHSATTTHHRPGSIDFLEWRSGKSNTVLLTGGLPFAQRHGSRMLDLILLPPGEAATSFEIFLGCDRPQPALAAQAVTSPVAVVPMDRGPPPAGAQGWLAHLDATNVLLTSLQPATSSHAVLARLFEVGGVGGPVNFRWARNPANATLVDGDGSLVMNGFVDGDTVNCDVMAHDLINLQVNWDQ